ncbi:MAG: response regulator [Planctomycetaceae bacterium]|nr:response regulator [Planctomycetaceae bacterium]
MRALLIGLIIIGSITRDYVIFFTIVGLCDSTILYNLMFTSINTMNGFYGVNVYSILIFQIDITFIFLIMRRSITAINQYEQAVANANYANQSKDLFLANISHEIRTPMNTLYNYTGFISKLDLTAEARQYLQVIRVASNQLLTLINDILDFSKINAGMMDIAPAPYEISSLINNLTSAAIGRISNRPIRFLIEVDQKLPSIMIGDVTRIMQIMSNLLVNAIKFTDTGYVKLSIWCKHSNGNALLYVSVQDSGSGIGDADREKLFRSFQQLNMQQRQGLEGTGLGLAISRKLIEMMDGAIMVESKKGIGSTFTFMVRQRLPENSQPIVDVDIPMRTKVVIWEKNTLEIRSWKNSLDALEVSYLFVSDVEVFKKLLETEIDTHFFIDSQMFKHFGSQFVSINKSLTVVTEFYETLDLRDQFNVMRRPVFVLPIVAALTGSQTSDMSMFHEETYEQFTMSSVKILVVDDYSPNLDVMTKLLEPYSCTVVKANGGNEAIDIVKNEPFDIIFMDHQMPLLNGTETTRIIRKLSPAELRNFRQTGFTGVAIATDYFEKLPIIATTANAIAGMKEKYLADGFTDYISKPINPARLNELLQRWIDKDSRSAPDESRPKPTETQVVRDVMRLKLPYLNVRVGLSFTNNDMDGYIEMLRMFKDRAKSDAQLLLKKMEILAWDDIKFSAHSIKGISRGIGADKLSSIAEAIEQASKNKAEMVLHDNADNFVDTMNATLDNIKSVLDFVETTQKFSEYSEIQSNTTSLNQDELITMLNKLDEILGNYDYTESINIIEAIPLSSIDFRITEQIAAALTEVKRFDYEKAQQNIKEAIRLAGTIH